MGASQSSPSTSTRSTPLRTPSSNDLPISSLPDQTPIAPSRPSPFRRLAPSSITRRDSKRSHASSSRGDNTDKRARNAEPVLDRGNEGEINFDGPSSSSASAEPNTPINTEAITTYPQPGPSTPPRPIHNSWPRRSTTSQTVPRIRPPLISTSTTTRSINRLSSFFGLSTPSTSTASFPTPLPPSTPLTSPFAPSNLTVTQSRIDQLRNQLNEIEGSPNAVAIPDLGEQISAARTDLDDTERQLENVRRLSEAVESGGVDPGGESGNAATEGQGLADVLGGMGGGGRIPAGAVLVIQGLAQAQVPNGSHGSNEGEEGDTLSETGERRGRGLFGRRRRHVASDEVENQARMIGGLLTVAAAATASTLLSPTGRPPIPSRSSGSIMSRFLNRNRPQPTDSDNVEEALGEYLNRVIRNNGRISDAGLDGEEEDLGEATVGFRRFLEGLQGDLLASVREFVNGGPSAEDENIGETDSAGPGMGSTISGTGDAGIASSDEVPVEPAVPTDTLGLNTDSSPSDPAVSTNAAPAGTTEGMSLPAATPAAVPAFHRQAGQNLPGSTTSSMTGVTGGRDGIPRRLNFFRAHVFPQRTSTTTSPAISNPSDDNSSAPVSNSPITRSTPPSDPSTASTTPPTTESEPEMVPCIFIGVRSISHAPGMSTEDLVRHPSFPFNEGEVPEADPNANIASASSTNDDALPPNAPAPHSSLTPLSRSQSTPTSSTQPPLIRSLTPPTRSPNPLTSPRPNLRSRLLSRFRRNSTSSTSHHRLSPSNTTNNTYLVYVIGGNYPSNHPILRIPSLITGAPLSDEEMNMISEMMGQVKPPTVSREGIEKAGLRVVKGEEMRKLGEEGVILDSCVERCLICLGDYDEGEECRVLNCRHGYHKECVDQWLSQGRNNCPACRSEAVDSKTTPPPESAPASGTTELGQVAGSSGHHEV